MIAQPILDPNEHLPAAFREELLIALTPDGIRAANEIIEKWGEEDMEPGNTLENARAELVERINAAFGWAK